MDQSILWKFRVINILSSVTLIFHKINDLNFKYLKSLAFVTVHTKTHGTNFGHVLGYWNVNVMSGTWVHKRTNLEALLSNIEVQLLPSSVFVYRKFRNSEFQFLRRAQVLSTQIKGILGGGWVCKTLWLHKIVPNSCRYIVILA